MKKTVCFVLSACLLLACFGAGAETVKHERVYAVLDAKGEVQTLIDSVRLENGDGLDVLTDRTMLTDLENVGGQQPFTLDGEEISFEAAGEDVVYQGTSDKPLPVTPEVTLTLNGEESDPAALRDLTGEAVLRISYAQPEPVPCLAATVMLLPESGVSNVSVDHGRIMEFNGHHAVVGWALPGLDEKLDQPAEFEIAFTADHAELKWMMTFATAEPVAALCGEIESRTADLNLNEIVDEGAALLAALRDGEELPELSGILKDVPEKIAALNSGVAQLDDGAAALADGAGTLAAAVPAAVSGLSNLSGGLTELTKNSADLNKAAEMIFNTLLAQANAQIAAAGLDAMGITVPELTAENYAEVLTALAEQMEAVKAAVPGAEEAAAQLTALAEQLGQIQAFVTGLKTYTEGVSQAAVGAALLNLELPKLQSGIEALRDGAAQLQSEGTGMLRETLTNAEKTGADAVLTALEKDTREALAIYETTRDQSAKGAYDLRAEDGSASTVYVMRTDF